MQPAPIILTAAVLLMAACADSRPGGARLVALDATITTPCASPAAYLGAGDWEIITGRIGDALILCERKRAAAVAAFEDVAAIVAR